MQGFSSEFLLYLNSVNCTYFLQPINGLSTLDMAELEFVPRNPPPISVTQIKLALKGNNCMWLNLKTLENMCQAGESFTLDKVLDWEIQIQCF